MKLATTGVEIKEKSPVGTILELVLRFNIREYPRTLGTGFKKIKILKKALYRLSEDEVKDITVKILSIILKEHSLKCLKSLFQDTLKKNMPPNAFREAPASE